MKNQYFGDVNDYRKYGLLRILSDSGRLPVAICWMLTGAVNNNQGNNVGYIDKPEMRAYDPELFEILKEVIVAARNNQIIKDVNIAKEKNIIPSAFYYDPRNQRVHLIDNTDNRKKYFEDFFEAARGYKLIFFDPDNGLEVQSVRYGRSKSSKYLYWHELKQAVSAGHSVLIYQHFPQRKNRDLFIKTKATEIYKNSGLEKIYSFRTAHVVFFLVLQNKHIDSDLMKNIRTVSSKWQNQIHTKAHSFSERMQVEIRWLDGSAVTRVDEARRAISETGFDIAISDISEVDGGMGLWLIKLPPELMAEFENIGKIERTSNNFQWENSDTYVDGFCNLPTMPLHLMSLIKD